MYLSRRSVSHLVGGVATVSLVHLYKRPSHCSQRDDVSVASIAGSTVIFKDKAEFDRKRDLFVKGGNSKLQVISDFDYTLTKFFVDGHTRGASCHCLIEDSGFLSEEYRKQAKALFHYYYPLEVSHALTITQKIPLMVEWVEKAHDLMLTSGLRKSQIKFAVAEALQSKSLALRDGVPAFLKILDMENVPILLFSAGLGDVIEEVIDQQGGGITSHMHVVSNHMIFDNDKLVGFSEPTFHVFNKKAGAARHSPFFKRNDLIHRENLILLGDSLGDIAMSEGLHYKQDSIIRIGFLNDKVERLPSYLDAYDVVIVGDPNFDFPLALVNDILAGDKITSST